MHDERTVHALLLLKLTVSLAIPLCLRDLLWLCCTDFPPCFWDIPSVFPCSLSSLFCLSASLCCVSLSSFASSALLTSSSLFLLSAARLSLSCSFTCLFTSRSCSSFRFSSSTSVSSPLSLSATQQNSLKLAAEQQLNPSRPHQPQITHYKHINHKVPNISRSYHRCSGSNPPPPLWDIPQLAQNLCCLVAGTFSFVPSYMYIHTQERLDHCKSWSQVSHSRGTHPMYRSAFPTLFVNLAFTSILWS